MDFHVQPAGLVCGQHTALQRTPGGRDAGSALWNALAETIQPDRF
jgi:hypothetical protein